MPINPQPIDFDNIDLSPPVTGESKQRKERIKTVSKASIRSMFERANMAFTLTNRSELKLDSDELDALADAWYDVAKEYPQFMKLVSRGNKFSIWGNALFVTYAVVERRRAAFSKDTPGPTLVTSGNDREREDFTSAARAFG